MKFLVEFHLKPGSMKKAVELFEQVGPNRNPGVAFRGAWVGTHTEIAFVLIESDDENLVTRAAQSWSEHGDFEIHPVLDIENF